MRLKIAHAPSLMSSILFPSLMSSILFPSLMSSILFPSLMSSILFPSLMSSILFPSLMSSILFPSLMSSILFPSLPPLFHPSRCTLPVFSQQNRIPLLDPPFPHSPFPPPPPPRHFFPPLLLPSAHSSRRTTRALLAAFESTQKSPPLAPLAPLLLPSLPCCSPHSPAAPLAPLLLPSLPCCSPPPPLPSHCSGSERCAEAVERLKGQWDVVVNIQGDEPLIGPGHDRCRGGDADGTVGELKGQWDVVVNIQGDEPLIDPATIDAVVIALQVSGGEEQRGRVLTAIALHVACMVEEALHSTSHERSFPTTGGLSAACEQQVSGGEVRSREVEASQHLRVAFESTQKGRCASSWLPIHAAPGPA
ncbi:unnamed protein product, partial [Closterium sp. NIES-65]